MLLEVNEISVLCDNQPGRLRLSDWVVVRLELQSIDPRLCLDSTIMATVTLGDPFLSNGSVCGHTVGFDLAEIKGCAERHERWKNLHARGKFEQGFLEFLLRCLRQDPEIHLRFSFHAEELRDFEVTLGADVKLLGVFPRDESLVANYFEVATTEIED